MRKFLEKLHSTCKKKKLIFFSEVFLVALKFTWITIHFQCSQPLLDVYSLFVRALNKIRIWKKNKISDHFE